MNTIIFQLRRFLMFLSDSFVFPFIKLRELWADPKRGRSLIFGIPALVTAFIGIITIVLAVNSQTRFVGNYEIAKDRAVQEKNWGDAIVYMQKITQFRPEDDSTKWELAQILLSDDRTETLELNRSRALSLLISLSPLDRPRFAKAHVWRANNIMAARQFSLESRLQATEQQLKYALDLNPDYIDARILLAERVLIPSARYKEALDTYVELFRDYVAYYVKIFELNRVLGHSQQAHTYLEEAVERYGVMLVDDPQNVEFLRRRANAYAMLEKYDVAAATILEAVDIVEDALSRKQLQSALARIYLAKALSYAKDVDTDREAREHFLDSIILAYETDPEIPQIRTALTRFGLAGYEESARAQEVYDPRDNPDDATDASLQAMGTHEVMSGDKTIGIRMLEMAIQKNPRNHEALNNLAYMIMDDDLPRAFELISKATALSPGNPRYLDSRGSIHMRMGNYKKAINDLEKARLQLPNNIVLLQSLVHCYTEEGMVKPAADFQKKVDELLGNSE